MKLNRFNTISEIDSSLIIPISDDSNTAPLKKCTIAQLSDYFNSSSIKVVGVTIDGGGSVPSTGVKGYIIVPFSGTIVGWRIIGDVSGSAVADVWKVAYGASLPTVSNTIAASAKPTLSSSTINKNDTVVGWTTSITADDIIGFNLDSISTITKLTIELKVSV